MLWIVTGGIGLFASFELANEYMKRLQNPEYTPNCSFNLLVTCTPNMESWQGHIFGFSNTIIGLVCFVAPIIVAVSSWAGARITVRWFWLLYNLGWLGAYVLITWLYSQSIFDLHTLCPWCMVIWAVTIPGFWYTTSWNLRSGRFGARLAGLGDLLFDWAWVIAIVNYLFIALLAQIELDWVSLLV